MKTAWSIAACFVSFCTFYNGVASQNMDEAQQLCIVADKEIGEASGMAVSRENPNHLWLHNDSGDSARLFLINREGETVAVVSLSQVEAVDWEDMCSFTVDGEHWLLIADTGDNSRVRTAKKNPCRLMLFREPKIELTSPEKKNRIQKFKLEPVTTLHISYPDGPTDCESVAVDLSRREILFVTKTDPINCQLLRTKLILNPGIHTVRLESISRPGVPFATAMDVSPDGQRLLICSMFMGVILQREKNGGWEDATVQPLKLPPRRQGETSCFDVDDSFALFGSEGILQPIWRMKLTSAIDE